MSLLVRQGYHVLWRPKRTEAKKETAAVPVFEDGDDETTGKRTRDDDAAPNKRARAE